MEEEEEEEEERGKEEEAEEEEVAAEVAEAEAEERNPLSGQPVQALQAQPRLPLASHTSGVHIYRI